MRSRFLAELTTPQVQEYLKNGDLALLPVGCVEMHGPHQPVGTDTYIAKAIALRLAEEADGVVLPEVQYTWAGATDGFAGTISVPPELVMQLVEAICRRAVKMGFRRIALVNVHGPGQMVLGITMRRFFEKHGVPLLYIGAYGPISDEADELFSGDYASSKEAALVLASLKILGREGLYKETEMAYDDEAPRPPDSFGAMRPATAGFFMQDPRQHACPSKLVSLERGERFIELQVRDLLAKLRHLDEYIADVKDQQNRGWWAQ